MSATNHTQHTAGEFFPGVEFKDRQPWRVAVHTSVLASLYASCLSLGYWADNWGVWASVWVILALILVGLTSLIHECIHGLVFRSQVANRLLGTVASCVIFRNFTQHRLFHLAHHRWTTMDGDPEGKIEIRTIWGYVRLWALNLTIASPYNLHGWRVALAAWAGFQPDYVRKPSDLHQIRADGIAQVLWVGLVATGLYFFPGIVLRAYVVPMALFSPVAFFLMLPEHFETETGNVATSNTRSVRSNSLLAYLFWNNNYHAEHHAFPAIPYYHLPLLSQYISSKICYSERSYLGFHLKLIHSVLTRAKDSATSENGDAYSRDT